MTTETIAPAGMEYVKELDGGDGEDATLYRIDSTDVEIGEAVEGVPVVAQSVEYVVAVEARMGAREIASMMFDVEEMSDEECEQAAVMLTGNDSVHESAVAVSNEDGAPGPVITQERDVGVDEVLAIFAADQL